MKFAKVEESAIEQHLALTGEELRLYVLIKFHTWSDTGVCNKTLRELCDIHGLVYNHTTERYKKLRAKGWCENSKKGIRPLIDLKTPKIGVTDNSQNSKNRSDELQKSEFESPKIGVNEAEKLQKSELHLKEYIEPLKSRDFSDTTHGEKSAGARVENNNNLSKFSISECLDYALLCQSKGDEIRNPRALAITLHKSGEADAFIEVALYPEQTQTQEIIVEPHGDDLLTDALNLLIDLRANGEDVNDFEKYYPPEIWARLMEALR